MAKFQPRTKFGYDLYEAISAVQKAIRRGDVKVAGYFGIDILESGFGEFLWDRLLVTSAEDCWGILTQEIESLYRMHKRSWDKGKKTRVFVSKAIILLGLAKKSRDADHLTNFIHDKKMVDSDVIELALDECRGMPIPDYALDVHTKRGKIMGRTKEMFFKSEYVFLANKEKGLFDDVVA